MNARTLVLVLSATLTATPALAYPYGYDYKCHQNATQSQWMSPYNGARFRVMPDGRVIKTFSNRTCRFLATGRLNRDTRYFNARRQPVYVRYEFQNGQLMEVVNGGPYWGGTMKAMAPINRLQPFIPAGYQPYQPYRPYPPTPQQTYIPANYLPGVEVWPGDPNNQWGW